MEDYKKKYETAINQAKEELKVCGSLNCDAARQIFRFFPELKESEDEKFLRYLIDCCKATIESDDKGLELSMVTTKRLFAWLEKQGTPAKLSEEEQNRFAKGVLTSCALSFIDYLDAHKYEGKMCVSNGECEDIENAFHNAMWDRLHRYYCKYIEKQGEQKPVISSDALREGIAHFGITQYQIDNWLKKYVDIEKQGEKGINGKNREIPYSEQKPAWSEEDEKMWITISDLLWEGFKLSDGKVSWDKIRCWLLPKITYFKDRVQTHPKQEWSEEDEKLYTWCASAIQTRYNDGLFTMDEYRETSLWLKSLKERMKGE